MTFETPSLIPNALLSNQPATRGVCLNITSHLDARFGGIATSLPDFCRATAVDWDSYLLGVCSPEETVPAAVGFAMDRLPAGHLRWAFSRELRRSLEEAIAQADIVHVHGIWQEHCMHACSAARRTFRPYVVSAHGMLDSWAIRQKLWRKAPYMALWERRNLASAACLRALTNNEVLDYRREGFTGNVAVVPNGVSIPAEASPELLLEAYPELKSRRTVLFLGRLHPKKGVDLLCSAWSKIAAHFPDTVLLIAGPDSDGTMAHLKTMVESAGIAKQVVFAGMLAGPLKWSALAASDVFVLPSHSEGFSVSTIEALGMGIPVIITRQCWFPQVAENSCGWIIEPTTNQIADMVTESLSMSNAERAARRDNARKLVETHYSWPVVGRKMAQVYEWIVGGSKPESVEVFP
jgi:glycosyltransferase involved in cell wall biosynthesis